MTSSPRVPEPGALAIDPGGALRGRTGSYGPSSTTACPGAA